MKPLELLTIGLTRGDKIELTYKNWIGETQVTTCYFGGYRNFMAQGRIDNEYDLVPIFYEEGKNGKMRNRRLDNAPYTDDIINIRVLEEKPCLWENEFDDLYLAYRNLDERAFRIIKEIVSGINRLYPGKKIVLGEHRDGGYINYKYGADFANVTALYLNGKGELVIDYYTNGDNETGENYDELDIDSTSMLSTLSTAIREPNLENEDQMEENFINPEKTKWNEIPTLDPNTEPAANRLNHLLNILKANLWYQELEENRKKEVMVIYETTWDYLSDDKKVICYMKNS